MNILSLAIGFLIGAAVAAGLTWVLMRQRTSQPLAQLQDEHRRLKAELTDHFVRTSEKVEELSESYRTVMAELRDGATQLVDEETLIERLGEDRARRLLLVQDGPGQDRSREKDETTEAELVEPPRY